MFKDSFKYLDRTPQVLDVAVFEPGNSNVENGIEDGVSENDEDGNFQIATVATQTVIEEVPPPPPPPSLDKSLRDELEAGVVSPLSSPSPQSPRSRKKAGGSSRTAAGSQRFVGNNARNGAEQQRVLIYPPDEDIDPEAELISAASSGRLESVRELLDLWANALVPFEEHFYPLYMACQSGHFEVAVLLLERNCGSATLASTELDGATALFACAEEGHVDCARLVLAAGADVHALKGDGSTPLLAASARGHATLSAVLLLAGSNVGHEKESTGCTALHLACQEGFEEVCSVLLAHGADPNTMRFSDGASPLLLAAQEGHLACLEALLAASAHSAEDQGLDLNAPNAHGESALFVACAGGESECAAVLLERGASVDLETPDGMTGLLFASQLGDDEVRWLEFLMVQILLDHGADPNHTKANGHVTPLVLAAMGGHLDCVRKLLVRGASTKAVQTTKELPAGNDREEDDEEDDEEEEDAVPIGATALSLAVARGHEDVAALLQMHDEMSKCEL